MKRVGDCYYVHKSNRNELISICQSRNRAESIIASRDDYEVIKYDKRNNKLSLIQSPDWDIANEPVVGDSYVYDLNDGSHKIIKGRSNNPQIYHNKWMFVADDYKGFDIEKAKQRTAEWNAVENIDKKRIGNQDYWFSFLDENNLRR